MSGRGGITAAEIAAARRRLPAAFGPAPRVKALRAVGAVALLAWLAALFVWFDISPARVWNGISGVAVILRQMVPPSPGEQWADILRGLFESVAMAFLGTFIAALIALPLGFLGARNIVVNALAHFSLRRVYDGFRGIDQLIWALAFVRAVGLGPLAGLLAIIAADIFIMAKLLAEAVENTDKGQKDGITATGANGVLAVRYGVLPQVLPVFLAQVLYAFESNVRSATILGVVGAGGIGLQIAERIKVRYWDEVCFIILLILVTVAVIDRISAAIRRRVTA